MVFAGTEIRTVSTAHRVRCAGTDVRWVSTARVKCTGTSIPRVSASDARVQIEIRGNAMPVPEIA
eukprot:1441774-Rhodomonas_salina.1